MSMKHENKMLQTCLLQWLNTQHPALFVVLVRFSWRGGMEGGGGGETMHENSFNGPQSLATEAC